MHRFLPLLAVLCLAFAPAPFPKPPKPVALLDGTSWICDFYGKEKTYFFEKGGVLVYGNEKKTYRNGTWSQNGNKLYWETNKGYSEFRGIINGDEITGKWSNVQKLKLELKMNRRARPKP